MFTLITKTNGSSEGNHSEINSYKASFVYQEMYKQKVRYVHYASHCGHCVGHL